MIGDLPSTIGVELKLQQPQRYATAGWSRGYTLKSCSVLTALVFLHLPCTCMLILSRRVREPPSPAFDVCQSRHACHLAAVSDCFIFSSPRLVLIKRRLQSYGSNLVAPEPNCADPSPSAGPLSRDYTRDASRPEHLNVQGVQPCSPRVTFSSVVFLSPCATARTGPVGPRNQCPRQRQRQ